MPRLAVRLLHARHDHDRRAIARTQPQADPRPDCPRPGRQSLPLHRLLAHHRRHRIRGRQTGQAETMTAPPISRYFGKPIKRVEDPRLIKGVATYVDDITLPGMLHAAIVRSPYAHARINSIKSGAAKALPGVVGVFTGAEVNDRCGAVPCGSSMPDLKAPIHTAL